MPGGVLLAGSPAGAAGGLNPAANLDQCQNGQVGPPIVLHPCLNGTLGGTAYSDWVNGNVNGQKAHWREGEFLTYRTTLTGMSSGSHTLKFQYDTVHGGKHAIDYIGSFDATETTATAASQFHANNNNPCFDKLGSAAGSGCTAPGTPVSSAAHGSVPDPVFGNCGGSSGTFGGTLPTGRAVNVFAPTNAAAGGVVVTNGTQNVPSGTGQCSSFMNVTFTLGSSGIPAAGWTVVRAWGGHIASQLDWGFGKSASAISGSPYHMALDTIDGITLGSQDRALSTSAVFFTPGIVTAIKTANGTTVGTAATPGVDVGTVVHDTAALTGNFSPLVSGTVTYSRYAGTTCGGPAGTAALDTATVNVGSGGTIPDDPHTYTVLSSDATNGISFRAVFNGDGANDLPATSDCEPLTVQAPNLTISKLADVASVSAGDNIGFTITVGNSGPGTAAGVTLSDPLPGHSGVNWAISPAYPGPGTCTIGGSAPNQTLSCSFGDMATGASASVHIQSGTTADSCSTYPNTATASATNDGSVQASDTVTVNCPSLTLTKAADNTTVDAGDPIGFTIVVTNTGAGTSHNTTLSDPLPAGSGVNWSVSPTVTGCDVTGPVGTQTLACALGDLAQGASVTVHVTSGTAFVSCADYPNTATAQSDNNPPVQAQASLTVVCPALGITKQADAPLVNAGGTIGFLVTVTNTATDAVAVAHNVTLSDALPTGSGVSWSIASQPAGTPCSISSAPQTLSCSFGDLGALASVSVHVTSATSFASCADYPNTALAQATNNPQVSANASITVQCPSLGITKRADNLTVSAGQQIGFGITVSNSGPGTATAVTLNDPLPGGSGVQWSIDADSTGGCSIAGTAPAQTLTCNFGDLAAGGSASVHVISGTSSLSCAQYPNTATAQATNHAPVVASALITVICPSLVITKTADAATVAAGSQIGFVISVTNNGPGDALGATLSDPLPTGSGVSWSILSQPASTPCSISGAPQSLSCSFGTLANGDSVSIHIVSGTNDASCGAYPNTASAQATNNAIVTASATTSVACRTAQITPTNTTCSQFLTGTAGSLTEVDYSVKSHLVNSLSPGVFFYYSKVIAPASTFTVDADQSNDSTNSFPNFPVLNGQAVLYRADCTTVGSGVTVAFFGGFGDIRYTISGATSGAAYVLGIKYQPSNLKGATPPAPQNLNYTFDTKVNAAQVLGSVQGLQLIKK